MSKFLLIYRLFYQINRGNSPRTGQWRVCGLALSKTHQAKRNNHFALSSILPFVFFARRSFSGLEKYF